MLLRRVSASDTWALGLDRACAQCRVAVGDDDALIGGYIAAACGLVGAEAGWLMREEVWTASLLPVGGDVILPKRPVTSLDAVTWFDVAGDEQTGDIADFYLFADEDRAYVRPKSGVWPATQVRDDALTLTFTAGGDAPEELVQAAAMMVSHFYDTRGAAAEKAPELIRSFEHLIAAHRVGWVGA